ncbi:MAG TPA: hypothetical protein VFI79_09515 [Gemmatimonadales bacterium]|nr:hypothetical protein [Gemmatimonadales bacterium]
MSIPRGLRPGLALILASVLGTCGKAGTTSGPPPVVAQLGFKVGAQTTTAGAIITPAVVVQALDANGQFVSNFSDSVTVSLVRNPGNGTLSGTTTVAAVGGVATFTNLRIDRSGSGYRMQATSGTLSSGSGAKFDIIAAAATHIGFTVEPGTAAAGAPMTPALQVGALDSLGNVATSFTGLITVAITSGTGTSGAVLSGQTTLAATAGVATFSNISIDKVGAGYTLSAAAQAFPGVTSSVFSVIAGPAARLDFTQQPTTTTAGLTITPSVQVTAHDAVGNLATGFNGTITVSITSGTGTFGATLSGTRTVLAAGGVATLADLSINKSGTGYTLSAEAAGLVTGSSSSFDILTGPVAQLSFTVQPATATAGAAFAPAVEVSARDAAGNTVTSFSDTVTIALGANPVNGVLTGTLKVAAASGVASFSDLMLTKAGNGYRLQATAASWISTSNAFSVVAGAGTQFSFATQPTTSGAGTAITPPVQVEALDAYGNVVTSYSGVVDVGLGANPGAGTLSGTTSTAAIGGVATFATLSIDKLGAGYTLTASTSGGALAGATSAPFNVVAGAATQLAFTVAPSTTVAGATITPAVQVTALDAFGNTATGFNGTITVALGANPGGGGLSGTKAIAAVAGVATFPDLSIARNGTGYTLTAKATGLTTATSPSFDILLGPVAQLVFAAQPTTTAAGATITPAVQVVAQDAAGNPETGFTDNVTMTIGINPGGGTLAGTTTVAASGGVATFGDLSINKTGTGYRLAAASGTLTNTSNAFSVVGGPATHLTFTVQPVTTGAGAIISPAVVVTALDALGNTATSFTSAVTMSIANNPGNGTLGGTTTLNAVAGVATFSTLTIDKMGTGYTLAAAATGLSGATSGAFDITAGGAVALVFSVQPTTTTAGAAITPAVQVTAKDAQNNTATGFTGSVTVAIGTNPAGGNLSGTKTITAVGGVATFTDLNINRNGTGYTLTAKATGLPTATSAAFDILLGQMSQLVFTVQPTTTSAGTVIAPPVQVTAEDAAGNTVTSFGGNVTMSITVNPGGGTLSGTTTVAAASGVALFSDLSINKVGTGYRLLATSGSISNSSAAFSISGGAATHMVFTVPPSTTAAGTVMTPAVKVTALDSLGNTASSFTGTVTLAIGTNPGGGTLTGGTTVAVAGVATFSGLSIDKIGSGYTLKASSAGLPTITSTAFDIIPAPATKLVFSVQPSSTTAGATITPAVQVTAQDAQGNTVTSFTGSVTMSIGTNPGGGSLSGTKTVVAAGGVATFSDLSINRNGNGYTLSASSSGLAGATSTTFNILVGPLSALAFTAQPVTTTATTTIAPPVQVTARDSVGNTITSFTSNVTVSISANPGGGTLSGTTTVAAVAGVATFSNLSIDKVGTGYRLGATAGALTATSSAFSILAGTATKLQFTVQPGSTGAGAIISPPVQVTALDAGGNTATGFTGNVTMAIGTNPAGGTLSGTLTVGAAAGVATFTDLSINKLGTGYTLKATATALTSATSAPFNIVVGTATQLAFTVQPSTTTAGATITPAVKVTARDAQGNTVTSFSGNVTIAIGSNPGGGSLSGTKTVAAAAGVATFSDLSINRNGTGYTLTAASSGLAGATSNTFTINPGPVIALVFTSQPVTTTAATILSPAVQVAARDSVGNTVTTFTSTVTMSIAANPGGGTLSGTTSVAAVAGVATFSNLSIDKVGTGYRLGATAGALTGTSNAFSILAGTATKLLFTVQPTSTGAGAVITPPVEVTALDAGGNTATGFAGNVTMAIGTNPAAGTLSGTLTVGAAAGVATFTNLSINKLGTGYTLKATATGLTTATSTAFNIVAGAATKLVFTVQPSTTTAGATITPAVKVTAQDAAGNTVTSFVGNVTVAIGTNPGSGSLSGTKTVAAAAGVATFSDLSINRNGVGYTLTASSSGLTSATSTAFTINTGPVVELIFSAQPQTTTALTTLSAVQVTARDSVGNTVTSFTSNVVMTISANPGGGTLSGTTTVAAVAGVATFSNLKIDKVGTGYRLTATSGALSVQSSAFSITAGTATHLIFSVQPSNTAAGAAITPAVEVTALDAGGNIATGFVGTVAITIKNNPGAGTLSGTLTLAASNGVASFSNLSINNTGTGYTLQAASSGLTSATSLAFNIL